MKPSSMFYVHEADVVQIHHFLEECSLCAKSLSGDIFMYRSPRLPRPFFFFLRTTYIQDRRVHGSERLSGLRVQR